MNELSGVRRGWLRPFLMVAAGTLFGGTLSVLISRSLAASPSSSSHRSAKTEEAARTTDSPIEGSRFATLDARLRALELQKSVDAPPASATAASDSEELGDSRTVAPEQRKQEFWGKVRASEQAHEREPLDPTWSPKATSLFQSDFASLGSKTHFKVGSFDCRTTTCLARFEWPSRDVASPDLTELVHFPYRANCARSIVLEEEPTKSGSATATMLFDCESWRADGEPELQVTVPAAPQVAARPNSVR